MLCRVASVSSPCACDIAKYLLGCLIPYAVQNELAIVVFAGVFKLHFYLHTHFSYPKFGVMFAIELPVGFGALCGHLDHL